jgi:hypothetical protein
MRLAVVALAVLALPLGQHASLRFAGTRPLSVTGHGFAGSEKVRVTAHVGSRATTVRLRTSARGGFRATFARVTIGTCDPLTVEAVGARGERAWLVRRAPACAPR